MKSLLYGKRKFISIPVLFVIGFIYLPIVIGLVLVVLAFKKIGNTKLRYTTVASLGLMTLFVGNAWVAGFSTSNPSTNMTPVPSVESKEVKTFSQEINEDPTLTPTPTSLPTATPTSVSTHIKKISTPTPTIAVTKQQTQQSVGNSSGTSVSKFSSGGDKDCPDFSTHAEAQAYFNAKGGSPSNNVDRLDNEHDGIACENLP